MSESMNRKQNEDRQAAGRRLHLREVSSEYDDYDGIGADLKAGRVRLSQDIEDLAHILRIRFEHLQAIEHGRFADLPAPVYAVGFVRTYAEHVGLNGEDAIRRFKEEAEGLPHHTRLSFPTPEEESRVPRGWLLAAAAVVAVLVYAGWYYAENKDRLNLAEVPAVPERLADKAETAPAVVTQKPAVVIETTTPEPNAEPVASETTGDEVSTETAVETVVAPLENTSVQTTSLQPTSDENPEPAVGEESPSSAVVSQTEIADTAPVVTETPVAGVQAAEPVVQAEDTPQQAALLSEPVVKPASEPVVASVTETLTPTTGPVTASVQPASAPVETREVPVQPIENQPAENVATAPQIQKTVQPVTIQPAAVQPAIAAVETPAPAPSPTVATPQPAETTAPVVASVTPEQTVIPATSSETGRKQESFGSPISESRVEIHARVDVWVQVSSQDGNALLSRILRQGDSYHAPIGSPVFLTTGNAGALQILVDGKLIPPVGPPGAVRRDISLEPESLLGQATGNSTGADN
jgi:cytoskeleton protein RodZ